MEKQIVPAWTAEHLMFDDGKINSNYFGGRIWSLQQPTMKPNAGWEQRYKLSAKEYFPGLRQGPEIQDYSPANWPYSSRGNSPNNSWAPYFKKRSGALTITLSSWPGQGGDHAYSLGYCDGLSIGACIVTNAVVSRVMADTQWSRLPCSVKMMTLYFWMTSDVHSTLYQEVQLLHNFRLFAVSTQSASFRYFMIVVEDVIES